MRDYNFTVICRSGAKKTFSFQAMNYVAARAKLQELINTN